MTGGLAGLHKVHSTSNFFRKVQSALIYFALTSTSRDLSVICDTPPMSSIKYQASGIKHGPFWGYRILQKSWIIIWRSALSFRVVGFFVFRRFGNDVLDGFGGGLRWFNFCKHLKTSAFMFSIFLVSPISSPEGADPLFWISPTNSSICLGAF